MRPEQSASRRTAVAPAQTITMGPVQPGARRSYKEALLMTQARDSHRQRAELVTAEEVAGDLR